MIKISKRIKVYTNIGNNRKIIIVRIMKNVYYFKIEKIIMKSNRKLPSFYRQKKKRFKFFEYWDYQKFL